MTIEDVVIELRELNFQLKRIADTLEKIENNGIIAYPEP